MTDCDKETRWVLALASGASVAAAARKTGCSARTLFRRLEDDAFRRHVARVRGRVVSRATSIRAVATLRKLLDGANPSVKRMAARSVLESLARLAAQVTKQFATIRLISIGATEERT